MRTPVICSLCCVVALCLPQQGLTQTMHFNPNFDAGSGFYGSTSCVTDQPDGKLLVGGSYSSYDGTPVNGLCRLNADGTIDTSFHRNTQTSYSDVNCIALQADGKILVGGSFFNWDWAWSHGLARLNTDGTQDTAFHVGDGFANGFSYSQVSDIEIQPDGKIIVLGAFLSYDNVSRNGIARLFPDGSLDTTYDPGSAIVYQNPYGFAPEINSGALQPDGKLIAGGLFTHYGSLPLDRIARFNTDGTLDSAYASGLTFTLNVYGGSAARILSLTLQPDNKLLVGGNFSEVNGVPRSSLVRLLTNGQPDPGFNLQGFIGWWPSVAAQVRSIELQDDGKIIIGGSIDSYLLLQRGGMLRFFPDGSLDHGFLNTLYNSGYPSISSVCSLSDSSLVIAGSFQWMGPNVSNCIARLDVCGSFSVADINACQDFYWDATGQYYTESGLYYAFLDNSSGCDSIAVLSLEVAPSPGTQSICIVGNDSLTGLNKIVWEKIESPVIDSFYIYRETNVTGVYEHIGSTDADAPGIYIDNTGNPAVQPYSYRVVVLDTCGTAPMNYASHRSVHLMIGEGTGSSWNLTWTPYQGFEVLTYNIYRGTNPGNMTLLASVAGSVNSYTDLSAPASVYYQVEFVNPNGCDPAKAIDYSSGRSNMSTNSLAALNAANAPLFSLYPNPAAEELTIELTAATGTITLYSVIGAKVLEHVAEQQRTTLNVAHLAPGMYTVIVGSVNGPQERKFIKR